MTAVAGRADLVVLEPEKLWFDGDGNIPFPKVAAAGSFSLHGDGIDIDGKKTLILTGTVDETATGLFSGPFTVSMDIEGEETALWEGRFHCGAEPEPT